MSVIENVTLNFDLLITQGDDQVNIRLVSHLIKVISRILQKSLKYFNGTSILTSFVLASSGAFPVIFI